MNDRDRLDEIRQIIFSVIEGDLQFEEAVDAILPLTECPVEPTCRGFLPPSCRHGKMKEHKMSDEPGYEGTETEDRAFYCAGPVKE